MKKILILGSSGYIGKCIYDDLKKNRYSLYAPTSKKLNLLNINICKKYFEKIKPDIVIYSAGKHKQYGDNKKNYNQNIKMIENVLLSIDRNIKKFVFLSTIEVYGKNIKKKLLSENSITRPFSYYGKGKLKIERLLKKNIENKKLIILRLPGIFGGKGNYPGIIDKIIFCIKNKKAFTMYSRGNELRDYVYCKDIPKIIKFILSNKFVSQKTNLINFVKGRSLSINEIIKIIETYLNKKLMLKFNVKSNKSGHQIFNNSKFIKFSVGKFRFMSLENYLNQII